MPLINHNIFASNPSTDSNVRISDLLPLLYSLKRWFISFLYTGITVVSSYDEISCTTCSLFRIAKPVYMNVVSCIVDEIPNPSADVLTFGG